jgi:predicted ester cyclase
MTDLRDLYRDYIACLNRQDWPKLGQFVDDEAIHNGRRVGLSGYREMLERETSTKFRTSISTSGCWFPSRPI